MQDLTQLINDVQRSVIRPEDIPTVCKAVQDYYKYLAQVGYIKKEEAEYTQKDSQLLEIVKKYAKHFTKPDLQEIAKELVIDVTEEMTKADIIKLIGA